MKGEIKKVEAVTREIRNGERKGQKFSQIVITADVEMGNGDIKTLKAYMSTDYAVKYFLKQQGVDSGELIGRECECTIAKRKFQTEDGEDRYYNYIKFLNLLDENGEKIFLENDKIEKLPF